MSAQAPTTLARALSSAWRLGQRLGVDLCRVRPRPDTGDVQLGFANALLTRLQEDSDVTLAGRLMAREWYDRVLTWPATVRARPLNHNPQPILFITGLPRSGTTFANDLLAAEPRFRTLHHEDLGIDMARSKRSLELLFRDGADPIHAVHPLQSPPEDLQIMGQYVLLDLIMGVYGAEYVAALPWERQLALFEYGYRFEREFYDRLPIRADQRFVIKSPIIHLMYFEAFQKAFADYRMMVLVRDVPTSVLSSCHIFEVGMTYLKDVDPRQVGPLFLRYFEGYVRGLEALDAAALDRFLFFDFRRFVADPIAAIEKLYAWLDLPLTDEVRAAYALRQRELEQVHISKVTRPEAAYYNLDLEAAEDLRRRYAAIYAPRLI